MIFLGTSAAECLPDPFCTCPTCTEAMFSEDKKLKRRRSSLLLNEKNLIDFGSDVMYACVEHSCSLSKLENVFVTHSHEDHFDILNAVFLHLSATKVNPINIYMSEAACKGMESLFRLFKSHVENRFIEKILSERMLYNLVPFKPFTEYKIDEMTVIAAVGNHIGFFPDENSLNYLFNTQNGKIFYACDTGMFFPETFDLLKGQALDILVIEGTMGKAEIPQDAGHLNIERICTIIEKLKSNGGITTNTDIIVTHISHNGGLNHYAYEERLQNIYGKQIRVAYDGMRVEF